MRIIKPTGIALLALLAASCASTRNSLDAEYLHYKSGWSDDPIMLINKNVRPVEYDISRLKKDGRRFEYDDPHYEIRHGLDLSSHDGEIDFEKLKAEGIEFVILRLGYRRYGETGRLERDINFDKNFAAAKAAGLPVGIYVFSQAINDEEALEEARLVTESLNPADLELPVTFDPEIIGHDEARTDNVPGEVFTRNAILFCEAVKAAGFKPMIYMNIYWQHKYFDLEQLSAYPIWYADYEDLPQSPYHFEFWQYSAEDIVEGGGRKAIDRDLWFVPKKNLISEK